MLNREYLSHCYFQPPSPTLALVPELHKSFRPTVIYSLLTLLPFAVPHPPHGFTSFSILFKFHEQLRSVLSINSTPPAPLLLSCRSLEKPQSWFYQCRHADQFHSKFTFTNLISHGYFPAVIYCISIVYSFHFLHDSFIPSVFLWPPTPTHLHFQPVNLASCLIEERIASRREFW